MRMKNILFAIILCISSVSCSSTGNNEAVDQKLTVYSGNGFAITYPEGYVVNPKYNGVVIGGDITINVKTEFLPGCRKGEFPKNSYLPTKAGLKESQFERTSVNGITAFINISAVLAMQLVPLNELVVVVMCSPGAEVVDFRAKAMKILGSFVVNDEKKLVSMAKLAQDEYKDSQEPQPAKDGSRDRIVVDKKGLALYEYIENDDLFVRLPYRYFARELGSEIVIRGMGEKPGLMQVISISMLEMSSLPLDTYAVQSMGKVSFSRFAVGKQEYLKFDAEDSVDGKYTILFTRAKRNDIRITVKGSQGLAGQNLELIKSIVYR